MAALPRLPAQIGRLPAQIGAELWRRVCAWGPIAHLLGLAETAGWPLWRLVLDIAALALGPGRIGLAEYERLRLFDTAYWGAADRREVAGAARTARLARQANFSREHHALASDRLASSAYLAAHGLPTLPLLAIYRADLAAPGQSLLRTRGELRQFLEEHMGAPLLVTPTEGGCPRTLFAGQMRQSTAEIERLVDEAGDLPGVSWLIQPLVAPHPDIARQTGGRLTPVRFLTLSGDHGAGVWRALWRLGGRDDVVASLDLRTGAAVSLAPANAPHRAMPAPAGFAVPDWPSLKATAVEGARLFSPFGLLGWDIAATEQGPVILGLDPAPDLALHQLADRQGALTPEVRAFLSERRTLAAEHRKAAR